MIKFRTNTAPNSETRIDHPLKNISSDIIGKKFQMNCGFRIRNFKIS